MSELAIFALVSEREVETPGTCRRSPRVRVVDISLFSEERSSYLTIDYIVSTSLLIPSLGTLPTQGFENTLNFNRGMYVEHSADVYLFSIEEMDKLINTMNVITLPIMSLPRWTNCL